MSRQKGIICVLIGAGSFGFTPVFVKTGFSHGFTLGQINVMQMVIASLLIWSIVFIKGSSFRGLNRTSFGASMLTGSFVGLTSVFYYATMQYLPASVAIILLFQFVWIGVLIDWLISKIRPGLITWLAMAMILTGVFFASNILNGSFEELPALGFFFGFLSAITYAGFVYFSGKAAMNVDPLARTALMVTGSTILVILIFIRDVPTIPVTDERLWLVTSGVALVGTIMPPLFFAFGAHLISGSLRNVLSSIELPVAVLSAGIILSEAITAAQWIGTALIVLAIILNEFGNRLFTKN